MLHDTMVSVSQRFYLYKGSSFISALHKENHWAGQKKKKVFLLIKSFKVDIDNTSTYYFLFLITFNA